MNISLPRRRILALSVISALIAYAPLPATAADQPGTVATQKTRVSTASRVVSAGSVKANAGSASHNAGEQTADGRDPQSADSPQATAPAPSQTAAANKQKAREKVVQLNAVSVVGIAESQKRSIQIKRTAPNIEDSITAINIGQLPDISITASLQRITGVQINRSAGEGTSLSVRGLPEVSTKLNGMPFITPDNINSIQPNYGTLPAALFSGVDVFKSPTASILNSGISGTVNLHTYRPYDFSPGWAASGSVKVARGSVSKKTSPDASGLVAYSTANWGFLLSASYSNLYRNSSNNFSGTNTLAGTNSSDANNDENRGFISSWGSFPIPSSIVEQPDGSVVVNGIKNAAFLVPANGAGSTVGQTVQRKRKGLHLAFEANLSDSLLLNVNAFYVHQKEGDYQVVGTPAGGIGNAATFVPTQSRPTGVIVTNPAAVPGSQVGDWNQQIYTVQKYQYYIGGFNSEGQSIQTSSTAKNYTAEFEFNNGGPFTAKLRLAHNAATQHEAGGDLQFVQTNGALFGNHLFPGMSLPPTVYPGPPSQGGNHLFNPGGIESLSQIATMSMISGPFITLSPELATRIRDPNTYVSKGFDTFGYDESATNNYARLDGAYQFQDNWTVKLGAANSVRSAGDRPWAGATRVYAGEGASDPNGCLIRWVYDDQILDGGGVPGACTAHNATGYYHGNPIGNIRPTAYPSVVSDHLKVYSPEGSGVSFVTVDPHAMSDPMAFFNALAPGFIKNVHPTSSWDVSLHSLKAYGEVTFKGKIGGVPFSGNAGLRMVRTNLGVTQFLSGPPAAYGVRSPAAGIVKTRRSYTDWLPAINVAINLTPSLIWRLALSKNMMPLTLDQWGGGISRGFADVAITLPNGQTVLPVQSASSNGNPDLDPWRSTNFGSSLEYYFSAQSMVSVAVFDMNIKSFVQFSSVIECNLPDADGVVRHRCVPVSTLTQGAGARLKGVEADYKQALTFLPGFLSDTGFEINGTYSPSNTGKTDLAGDSIPFPENSEKSGNLILWYQGKRLHARVGLNYRSREAVGADYGGIVGLEEYMAPQTFVDASVSYQILPHLQVYLQGQNVTNEKQFIYLTWPDEREATNFSERYFMLGVRGRF